MQLSEYRLGLGTWKMGDRKELHEQEREAILYAANSGTMLIDTAEMYGEGLSEQLIGDAIRDIPRDSVFVVSKVYPHNASKKKMRTSCLNTLKRLGIEYLDLYLLHWRGAVPLLETVAAFEELKQEGLIRAWGVSNFDVSDMEELWDVPGGDACTTNQVMYHIGSRGVEYDLLPWMQEKEVPLMAYCPLAHSAAYRKRITDNQVMQDIAEKHSASVFQIMLAFLARQNNVIAIPKASSIEHVKHNLASLQIQLTEEDLKQMNAEFPAPTEKTELDML